MPESPPGVRVERIEGIPAVAVRIWLPGGSRVESIPGQALLAGRLLAEGTKERDWREISLDSEALGCSILSAAGHSVQAIAIDGLARDWERILAWAAELLLEPSFPVDRFAWLREQTLAELESLADLPEVVTGWAFLEQLYGDHPLGRPLQGTAAGLADLDASACARFHGTCLARGPLVAVTGEIDPEAVLSMLGRLLETCEEHQVVGPCSTDLRRPARPKRRIRLPPGNQAQLYIGGITVGRSDPDFEALQILGVVLGAGAGLVGRIPQRIREDEGLAYGCHVETVAGAGVDRGRLVVSFGTASADAERAMAIVREELSRLRREGPEAEEVELARSYLLGSEPFRRETARQQARLELESMLWRVPVSDAGWVCGRLEQVTVEDVRRAANRYLQPGDLVETIGLPN